jgi:serine/threonine protein kinase
MSVPPARPSIRDVFDRLVLLSRDDRDQALRELAARHPEVSAQVRSLLGHDLKAASEGFLPVHDDFGSSDDDSSRMAEPYPKGSRVGPYVVDRLVGRGDMGRVYRARRAAGAGPWVAVKVMRAAEKKRSLDAFVADRELQSRLDHPNIVRLLDAGEEDSGWPFLVMEYVDGPVLGRHCDPRERGLDERVGLVIDIARGVAYAHREGVLHGDLKPRNILVDRAGTPKITDFGLARRLGESEGSGPFGVTAGYSLPRLAGGADHRVDSYALAMILYRVATGREPFAGATALQVLVRASHQRPPRPRLVCPELPRGLEAIILKAMRKQGELGPDELAGLLAEHLDRGKSRPARGWWPRKREASGGA